MSLRIVAGGVTEYLEQLQPLLEAHVAELTTDPSIMVLEPRWDMYSALEETGDLFTFYAFLDDTLIGYACNFTYQHLHYGGLRMCENDVLFVQKEHRSKLHVGMGLIHATELEARKRGARMMLWHAKPLTPLSALLPRKGYKTQDIVFSRVLPESPPWE